MFFITIAVPILDILFSSSPLKYSPLIKSPDFNPSGANIYHFNDDSVSGVNKAKNPELFGSYSILSTRLIE